MSSGVGCPRPPPPGLTPPLSWLMTNSGLSPADGCCQVFGFRLFLVWARMLGVLGLVGEWTPSQTVPGNTGGQSSAAVPTPAVKSTAVPSRCLQEADGPEGAARPAYWPLSRPASAAAAGSRGVLFA